MDESSMSRKRRTISYEEASGNEVDLEQLLRMLRRSKTGPYWNRSLSDIGGMILLNGAQAEVELYCKGQRSSNDRGAES